MVAAFKLALVGSAAEQIQLKRTLGGTSLRINDTITERLNSPNLPTPRTRRARAFAAAVVAGQQLLSTPIINSRTLLHISRGRLRPPPVNSGGPGGHITGAVIDGVFGGKENRAGNKGAATNWTLSSEAGDVLRARLASMRR